MTLEATMETRRSKRSFEDRPISQKQLGQLLWCAQGRTGTRGLRAVPSAGATFPLEIYVAAGTMEDIETGLYKYNGELHALEVVKKGDVRRELAESAFSQKFIVGAPATIIIAADYRRTSGRYGERAPRYVHMEAGHAGQNVHLQCETLGLGTCMIGAFDDAGVKELLGIEEEPLYIIPVGYGR